MDPRYRKGSTWPGNVDQRNTLLLQELQEQVMAAHGSMDPIVRAEHFLEATAFLVPALENALTAADVVASSK